MLFSRQRAITYGIALGSLLMTVPVTGQVATANETETRIGVDVRHSGEDRVGTMLASALRDVLARSPRFRVDATSPVEIQVVTLDPNETSTSGYSTVASIAFTVCCDESTNNLRWFLTSQVVSVGRKQVETMAQEIVADLDGTLDNWINR